MSDHDDPPPLATRLLPCITQEPSKTLRHAIFIPQIYGVTKPNSSFLTPQVPYLTQKFVGEITKPRQPLYPHLLSAYCRFASPLLLTQPSQDLPIVVPCVHYVPWLPACGMAALFGVCHHRIVSTNITRSSTLLPLCSHLCPVPCIRRPSYPNHPNVTSAGLCPSRKAR